MGATSVADETIQECTRYGVLSIPCLYTWTNGVITRIERAQYKDHIDWAARHNYIQYKHRDRESAFPKTSRGHSNHLFSGVRQEKQPGLDVVDPRDGRYQVDDREPVDA